MLSDQQKKLLTSKFEESYFYTDTLNETLAIKRAKNCNIIVMDQFMWAISENFFIKCKKLELIVLNTTAYDRIPLDLLKKYKVRLVNLKSYATHDVADLAISMMMSLNSNLDTARSSALHVNFKTSTYSQNELTRDIWPGHTIIPSLERIPLNRQVAGVIGLGKIGKEIAGRCRSLGIKVIGYNRTSTNVPGVKLMSLKDVMSESDIIFIALKYEPNSMKGIISDKLLKSAKKNAILISIATSELTNISYLLKNPDKFKGIGFDCYVTDELIMLAKKKKENVIITPHLGHQSQAAYANLTNSIVATAIKFAENKKVQAVT